MSALSVRCLRHRLRAGFLLICLIGSALPVTSTEKSGGWRMALESSPYLRLHAGNPVEWYPWGEAAFEKARRENKPLFISIGYFTCHWCHVMERESFSNPEIAALLNEHFVSIKVDREQRPDVDAAYMNYVLATRGQGGWPMSVWATPQGYPFLGGTYFPPDAGSGRSGMRQIVTRLAELWSQDQERIQKTAGRAVAQLRRMEAPVKPLSRLTDKTLVKAREQHRDSYDELQGGFSPAPKFPQPARLLFLLQDSEQGSADMALHTLEEMAAGGIYDHLGGGFHRYSTDFEWRVPHFEKMLYDQALVARAYLFAWQRTRQESHASVAREVLDFTLTRMRDASGGFYSALSADSYADAGRSGHMEEGVYYTWTWDQLAGALGDAGLLAWAAARYGLAESGNALSDPLGEMAGRNVLYRAKPVEALARQFGVDLITARQRNAGIDQRLLASRRLRPAPPVDDKIVSAWNGYMITTLALAGRLLDEPRYIDAAGETAGFLLEALYDDRQGVLYRDWRQGERGVPGFAGDYASVAEGLLALYRVTGEKRWAAKAQRLVDTQLAMFWDAGSGGFYRTAADTELWVRDKEAGDGAGLSLNGVSVHALLALDSVTGGGRYRDKALETAAWAGAQLEDAPAAMSYLLIQWPELMRSPKSAEPAASRHEN